ncbi:hypothetical protein VI817_007313 [Penicillium citrinum]|nr:hypothetical protein VI817_007313 [Penicillium citrinum]
MAKEAKETSQKYSVEGLAAFKSKKRDANAPRANTRFLRHLIKETDNHNTALKRKEEREARERMRQSKSHRINESSSRRLSPPTGRHERERHSSAKDSERRNRDDYKHGRSDDRRDGRRDDDDHSHRRNHRHRSRSTSSERSHSRRHRRRDMDRSRSRDTDRDRERSYRRREDDRDRRRDREHGSSRRSRYHRRRTYSKSRSRSPRRDRSAESHRSRHNHNTAGRPSKSHRLEAEYSRHDKDSRPPRESSRVDSHDLSEQTKGHNTVLTVSQEDDEVDSDPLEDLIGPPPPHPGSHSEPPIRSRGRGAYKPSASNIDSHFAADYDPTVDIQPDEDEQVEKRPTRRAVPGLMTEEDDWDMALEALRDRARWKQKGEERLRAAGLNESIIDRWKDNTTSMKPDGERSLEEVRWSKKGEGREWDRGKVIDDQGHTDVHASW